MLYCTRSMNPIENEAVVTAVLDNGLCKVEVSSHSSKSLNHYTLLTASCL